MAGVLRNIAETTSRMAPNIVSNIRAPANILKEQLKENVPILRNVAEGLVDPIAMGNLAKTGATAAMCSQCRRLNCSSMGGKSKKAATKKKSRRRRNKGKKTRKH